VYSGPLGFLDCLSRVVMLLLGGVHREDGQLVELDAAKKRRPGTNTNALVGTSIHANPGVLGVHFIDNLVPLGSWITDDKATEHLICLLGFGNCKALLSLEELFVLRKHLLPDFLRGFGLVFRELEIGLHFPLNFNSSNPGHLDVRRQSFFLIMRRMAMTWTK
jgi:hypothetical protein